MNYVEVDNLYKSFAEKILFEDISFKIERGDKIALIARNGSGKTTLINVILGNEIPDSGKIMLRNDIHVNFLRQDTVLNPEQNVFNAIFESENEFIKCIKTYNECLMLSQLDSSPETLRRLEEATSMMDAFAAWDYESKVEEILQIFEIPDLNQKIGHLSGGQQKRLALAKVLIDKCDMLFLDEPTNHLDIEMIEWLENYLAKEKVTLFLISHDRYFIDNVCNTVFELDDHKLYRYKSNGRKDDEKSDRNIEYSADKMHKPNGAYSNFLIKKADREEMEAKTIEKARGKYRIELEWMRRQPQARQHKSKKRIETFYDIEKTARQTLKDESFSFNVQAARLGKKIMEVYNLSKAFGDKKIISNMTYTFVKGDRIGIVGKNGIGKSTFFKLLTEQIYPDSGRIVVGSTVKTGYFGQEGLLFNDDKKIIDIVKECCEVANIDSREVGASQFLSWFNFPPAVQYASFGKLSGGEKRRFYLIMVLLQSPNFLILDEPTNDLDIQTLNLLEEFLDSYEGVLLVASHDRLFLDKLSDHIFAFEGNGVIKDFPGNYTQYVEWKKARKAASPAEKATAKEDTRQRPLRPRKATYKETKEYEAITAEMDTLENEKKTIIAKLNDASTPADELEKLSLRYGEIDSRLSEIEDRWLELEEIVNEI